MPRNHHPAPSTLRNRNRITNKTRLKVHQGSLDADAVLIPDEDEEKHRLTNLVAGVDAEDANEHHLQEVLSAVRNNRHPRGPHDKVVAAQPAFIPTPDSTGVVQNYQSLYPADRWKDPITYVCTSTTVEESTTNGLANGFTYYLDERDKEWLDKNNEEARGEGTSAQGAVSLSGTRTSARSAKAKGKEPEASQPAVITEDEFELVMGIFEKVTHEKTEYLYHGLETGMDFPAFSEYQDVFSTPLPTTMFATYSLPDWIPVPATLLRIAKTVYPYWKERRIERGGHRIIPTLNGDESDTLNESYICFRRRESKAVRKTRASQVTSSDKLARLQMELSYPLELAKCILNREHLKKEVAVQSQEVWEKRLAFADLKRKFPATFNDKADEELLVDKERPVKKVEPARVPGLKIRTGDAVSVPLPRQEVSMKPKERYALIRDQIESTLARQQDADRQWEDQVDNPYQNQPVPYACRLFKYIPPSGAPSWQSPKSDETDEEVSSPPPPRVPRAIRSRYGRGGRLHLDRRDAAVQSFTSRFKRSRLFDFDGDGDDKMEVDQLPDDVERDQRLQERWRYDGDDMPAVGPQGPEEQDRELVDDFDTKFLRHTMTLFTEEDHAHLLTDPSILVNGPDGRPQMVVPYRLGAIQPVMRRDAQGVLRPYLPGMGAHNMQLVHSAMPNGTPVAMQHQIKKMVPPTAAPQMRISSNGGMRPPVLPVSISQTNSATPTHVSPPHPVPVPVPQHSPTGGVNGISRAAISMPHVDVPKPEVITTPAIPPAVVAITQPEAASEASVNGNAPPRPKTANATPQHMALGVPTNGYHLTPMTNMATATLATSFPHSQQNQHQSTMTLQQMQQNLKTAFANSELKALQNAGRIGSWPNSANMNMQLPVGSNMNLKLPATRQAQQWAMQNSTMQRAASTVNGIESQINSNMVSSPSLSHSVPVRSPSANGTRPVMRNGVLINGQHNMSPHMHHSPSPLPNISQSQSPPRVPLTPNMVIVSPSLQHQQPVGTTQSGY